MNCPTITRQRLADAIDIDNNTDYKEMVKKISDSGMPPIIKVFVDMRHIEKLPRGSKSKGTGSSGDDSEATSDSVRVRGFMTCSLVE